MFTIPSSIVLELVIGGLFKEKVIDRIDVEIPGKHVKALTSASQLVKEVNFSKRLYDKRALEEKNKKKRP